MNLRYCIFLGVLLQDENSVCVFGTGSIADCLYVD